MPVQDCLCSVVRQRLHAAFGKPHVTRGRGQQWTLYAEPSSIGMHVLLKGSPWSPAVWIFDPNDPSESGVEYTLIADEQQIAAVIVDIQTRLARSSVLASERAATDMIACSNPRAATRSLPQPRHGRRAPVKTMLSYTVPTLDTCACDQLGAI